MDVARKVIRFTGVVALLALLAVIVAGGGRPLSAGVAAPKTQGRALSGEAFSLDEWRGHVVVVNVWATWCAPCLQEMPEFKDAALRWRAHGVRFVGLAADSPLDKIPEVVGRFGLPYPIVPIDGATQHAWNAVALPSTYVLRTDGTVAWSVRGAITGAELDAALTDVVAQER